MLQPTTMLPFTVQFGGALSSEVEHEACGTFCSALFSLCPRRTGNRDLAGVGVERKGTRLSVDCCRPRTPGQKGPVDHAVKAHPSGGRRTWN